MVMGIATLLTLAALLIGAGGAARAEAPRPPINNWLVYYSDRVDPEVVARFDLVALDPDHNPGLLRRGPKTPLYLGYVSLGEAEPNRDFYKYVKGGKMLVDRNPDWNADIVDIRSQSWQRLLLDRVIPRIMAQGFDGLFLDTLDSAVYLELYKDPKRFAGMKDELVRFIARIRKKFPQALLCANRGREIWQSAARYLDFVVMEDFSTTYDFKTQTYQVLDQKEIDKNLAWAALAQKANPRLLPLVIDYVEPDDVQAAGRAIARARKHGLITYVSDVDLDQVYLYTLNQ